MSIWLTTGCVQCATHFRFHAPRSRGCNNTANIMDFYYPIGSVCLHSVGGLHAERQMLVSTQHYSWRASSKSNTSGNLHAICNELPIKTAKKPTFGSSTAPDNYGVPPSYCMQRWTHCHRRECHPRRVLATVQRPGFRQFVHGNPAVGASRCQPCGARFSAV